MPRPRGNLRACHPSEGWDLDSTILMNPHIVIPACFRQVSTLKKASQSDPQSFSPACPERSRRGLRPGLLLTINQKLNTKNYTSPQTIQPTPPFVILSEVEGSLTQQFQSTSTLSFQHALGRKPLSTLRPKACSLTPENMFDTSLRKAY